MICQRPGCTNKVAPKTNNMGPTPRFCRTVECDRIRHIEAVKLYQKRISGKAPKFRRKGPKKNRPKFAPQATIAPERSMSRPTEKVTAEEKPAPVLDGKMALVDRQAKLAGIDRGTREGFKRYMEERPAYFEWVFPRMTIAQAWGSMGGR